MTVSNKKQLRDLLSQMAAGHEENIKRVVDLKDKGVTVGAPTLEDIIERESQAVNNLRSAIGILDTFPD